VCVFTQVIAGRYTIAGKSYFHSECFKCTQCEALFPTGNPQFFTDGKGFYCHPCHEQIAAANRPAQARSAAEVTRNYRKSTIYKSPTSYVEKTRTQTLPPEIQALIGARTAGGAPAVSMSHFVKAIDSGVDAAVEFEKKGGKKEGFLKKKGAKRRNWKRRYFKLAGQTLSYHKTAEVRCSQAINQSSKQASKIGGGRDMHSSVSSSAPNNGKCSAGKPTHTRAIAAKPYGFSPLYDHAGSCTGHHTAVGRLRREQGRQPRERHRARDERTHVLSRGRR